MYYLVMTTRKKETNRSNINLDTESHFCIQTRFSCPQQHCTWAAAQDTQASLWNEVKIINQQKVLKSKFLKLSPNAWEAQKPGWPTREALLQAQAQFKQGMNEAKQHEILTIPVDHCPGWSSFLGCSVTTSPISFLYFFYWKCLWSIGIGLSCSLLMIKLA